MITISISTEAYETIKAALPKNAETWSAQPNGRGRFRITLPREFVDRLGALRRPDGESQRCHSAAGAAQR